MTDKNASSSPRFKINEDWLAVLIALLLVLLSTIDLLGPNGISIIY